MSSPLIESVVNISCSDEQALQTLHQRAVLQSELSLLDIHLGKSVNRSVLTLCGTPKGLFEYLVFLFGWSSQNIDMRTHTGSHPRIGAVDVCPLIPIRDISTQELDSFVHRLSQKVSQLYNIPVHLYAHSARHPRRKNLYNLRRGGYEALKKRLTNPIWQPDYGTKEWNAMTARSGISVIGHRDFMVAWNLSLKNNDVVIKQILLLLTYI